MNNPQVNTQKDSDTKGSYLPKELYSAINFENPMDLKIKNILQLFNLGRSLAENNGNCLGHRPTGDSPFEWISYDQFYELYIMCARGLDTLGIERGNEVNIVSYSRMSKETLTIIFGGIYRRNVIVPLYDTLGISSIEHIINETLPSLTFCDNESRTKTLLDLANFRASHIITSFSPSDDLKCHADSLSVKLITFEDLIQLGDNQKKRNYVQVDPDLDDVMYIMYTSGSTGTPKGVVLCHRQFVFNITTLIRTLGSELYLREKMGVTYYSYLPYQHSFENLVLIFILTVGGRIGISQGNVSFIVSDLQILRPTLMIAVPRILDRFRSNILDTISKSNCFVRFIFDLLYNFRKSELLSTNKLTYSFLSNIVFHKIHAIFGGKLKHLIVGGAPMTRDLEIFSRIVFGANLLQGYGLTETTSATTVQSRGNGGLCEVGTPMPGIEVKLIDSPNYGYFVKNGTGELCVRGPNVTRGYYKRQDIDNVAFDENGFFRSGDIARLNENGSYTIIDRCKNIFKLSQGEFIEPEKIETIYEKHPLVYQIMIYGESSQNYFVGLVIVESHALLEFAADVTDEREKMALLKNNKVKEKLIYELNKIGESNNLRKYEQIKKVVLDYNKFTVDNELLTPTMKIRRPVVTKIYLEELRELYESY